MIIAFYTSISVLCILASIWFVLKIMDWYSTYRASKFDNNKNWFLSELYKLARKCASIGEFEFAETLNELIRINSIDIRKKPGRVGLPLSNDAMSTELQLRKQRKQEIIDTLKDTFGDDIINEF